MKTTIKFEHLNRFDFFPCNVHIYRNGIEVKKIFLDMLTDSTLKSADEIKRALRKASREVVENRKLAVFDGSIYYHLRYIKNYKNIADEYEHLKVLKEQLEAEQPYSIIKSTAQGETEYKKQFKVIYAPSVA